MSWTLGGIDETGMMCTSPEEEVVSLRTHNTSEDDHKPRPGRDASRQLSIRHFYKYNSFDDNFDNPSLTSPGGDTENIFNKIPPIMNSDNHNNESTGKGTGKVSAITAMFEERSSMANNNDNPTDKKAQRKFSQSTLFSDRISLYERLSTQQRESTLLRQSDHIPSRSHLKHKTSNISDRTNFEESGHPAINKQSSKTMIDVIPSIPSKNGVCDLVGELMSNAGRESTSVTDSDLKASPNLKQQNNSELCDIVGGSGNDSLRNSEMAGNALSMKDLYLEAMKTLDYSSMSKSESLPQDQNNSETFAKASARIEPISSLTKRNQSSSVFLLDDEPADRRLFDHKPPEAKKISSGWSVDTSEDISTRDTLSTTIMSCHGNANRIENQVNNAFPSRYSDDIDTRVTISRNIASIEDNNSMKRNRYSNEKVGDTNCGSNTTKKVGVAERAVNVKSAEVRSKDFEKNKQDESHDAMIVEKKAQLREEQEMLTDRVHDVNNTENAKEKKDEDAVVDNIRLRIENVLNRISEDNNGPLASLRNEIGNDSKKIFTTERMKEEKEKILSRIMKRAKESTKEKNTKNNKSNAINTPGAESCAPSGRIVSLEKIKSRKKSFVKARTLSRMLSSEEERILSTARLQKEDEAAVARIIAREKDRIKLKERTAAANAARLKAEDEAVVARILSREKDRTKKKALDEAILKKYREEEAARLKAEDDAVIARIMARGKDRAKKKTTDYNPQEGTVHKTGLDVNKKVLRKKSKEEYGMTRLNSGISCGEKESTKENLVTSHYVPTIEVKSEQAQALNEEVQAVNDVGRNSMTEGARSKLKIVEKGVIAAAKLAAEDNAAIARIIAREREKETRKASDEGRSLSRRSLDVKEKGDNGDMSRDDDDIVLSRIIAREMELAFAKFQAENLNLESNPVKETEESMIKSKEVEERKESTLSTGNVSEFARQQITDDPQLLSPKSVHPDDSMRNTNSNISESVRNQFDSVLKDISFDNSTRLRKTSSETDERDSDKSSSSSAVEKHALFADVIKDMALRLSSPSASPYSSLTRHESLNFLKDSKLGKICHTFLVMS